MGGELHTLALKRRDGKNTMGIHAVRSRHGYSEVATLSEAFCNQVHVALRKEITVEDTRSHLGLNNGLTISCSLCTVCLDRLHVHAPRVRVRRINRNARGFTI